MVLHTLQIEHAYLLFVYTLLTAGNARIQGRIPGVKLFALYNALALLGAVAVTLRGSLPDLVSIVGGNLCVMAGYTALYGSMYCFFGFRRRQHLLAAAWLLFGAVSMIWLGQVRPDTASRLLYYSGLLILQQLHLAILLLFGPRQRRRMGWMLAMCLVSLAAANGVRIYTVLQQGAPADYRAAGPALAAVVLANACLQCGLMVAYVWMTAAQLRQDLELQANTDPLTGLLNRRAMDAAAAKYMRTHEGRRLSAVQLDLDSYKPINDRLGHAAGDQALVAVAHFLRGASRDGDLVARVGGDEFMLFLPNTSAEQAMHLSEVLCTGLEQLDLGLEDRHIHVTGSFGLSQANAGDTWDDLCLHCDRALYFVKSQGGNGVHCDHSRAILAADELFVAVP